MKTIQIAPDLKLPLDSVVQRKTIIAKNRVGKSNTGCVYVEEVHKHGVQTIVIDPKGDWYGIRSSADGKGEGLPFLVMGGDHGDIPLDPNAGKELGEYLGSNHVDVVLDVSEFSKRELARFAADFLEALYAARKRNRSPLNLVLEEADDFAPQQIYDKTSAIEQARCLGAVIKIAKKAGFLGIGLLLITQRTASLNKNVLSQSDLLIIMRTTAPQDIKAADAWLQNQGEEERSEVLANIQSLPTGAAYVWAPEAGIFKKVQLRRRETFDAGFTPKVGESRPEPKVKAKVDLQALQAKLAAVVEKAKADDPDTLKAKIRTLEKELANSSRTATERVVEKEVHVVQEIVPREILQFIQEARALSFQEVNAALDRVAAASPRPIVTATNGMVKVVGQSRPRSQPVAQTVMVKSAYGPPDETLSAPERRILTVLAQRPEGCEVHRLAILAGYTVNGHFNNIMGGLRTKEYITPPRVSPIQATTPGLKALGSFEPLPTGEDLQKWWLGRLTHPEGKILQVLLASYPQPLEVEELASRAGYTVNGHFNNVMGSLRGKGLISPPRMPIKAADDFFED